jgi:hypothetical protein
MKMFRKLILTSLLMMAAVFPVAAQQGPEPAPAEDHGAHHGGTDQAPDARAPGDGPMGQDGMMGQGGMMGEGMCPMMGDMMGGKRGMKKRHGMMMHSVPMMEGRLAYTKADLEITEAQMPAWNEYADAVRARHTKMEGLHADMMKAKESGSALQRMDARIKGLESMLDSLKALKPATVALYAVLTDEQKKKADQLLGGRCGMM